LTAELEDELDQVQVEIRKLKRRQDDISEGRDWNWRDTPEEIAAAFLRLQPHKAPQVAAALLNLSKSTARQPRARKAAPAAQKG